MSEVVYRQGFIPLEVQEQRDFSLNIFSSNKKSKPQRFVLFFLVFCVLSSSSCISDAFEVEAKTIESTYVKTVNTDIYKSIEIYKYNLTDLNNTVNEAIIYQSDFDYLKYAGEYSFDELRNQIIWNHAFDLYDQGLIVGADKDYQCVLFAQMWFYDVYHINSSKTYAAGDGKMFADGIINAWSDEGLFEYGEYPKQKGIVSVSSKNEGHVMCVDDVDYDNGTITISDGNYDSKGSIRLRYKMSLEEFYDLYPGYYTYVNPITQG